MGKEFVVNSLEDMCALMCDNNTERLEERKMADIELVIKIDEDYYEIIKHGVEDGSEYKPWTLIAHGTPLPKGHGRLIDADELNKCIVDRVTMPYVPINKIQDAPTIIEADRESEE